MSKELAYRKDDLSTADWFYNNPGHFLSLPIFKESEREFGPDFKYKDLYHEERGGNKKDIIKAQRIMASKSRFTNATMQNFAGFLMPVFYYTGDTSFAEEFGADPENYNPNTDNYWLISDQGDSLRRRNLMLSKLILPEAIIKVSERLGRKVKIANFGSGTGLSVLNALSDPNIRGRVESAINYDTDKGAIFFGKQMLKFLRREGMIDPNVKVDYRLQSLMRTEEDFDIGEETGVICSVPNASATKIVGRTSRNMNEGGIFITTSSNYNMEKESPFTSFQLQHMGTTEDYKKNWFLNCRSEESIQSIFNAVGLKNIQLYGDFNYPRMEKIMDDLFNWTDPLPALALGMKPKKDTPKPPRETLEKKMSHNWIVLAEK